MDILESALKHHPGSDELLLQLVDAASVWLEREDLEVIVQLFPYQ